MLRSFPAFLFYVQLVKHIVQHVVVHRLRILGSVCKRGVLYVAFLENLVYRIGALLAFQVLLRSFPHKDLAFLAGHPFDPTISSEIFQV